MSGRLSTFATLHLSDVHHETVDHSGAGAHRLVSFTAFERYDHIGSEGVCTYACTFKWGCHTHHWL